MPVQVMRVLDPKVGDLCQGTVSACFNDNWLVCGPLGKLILNDICNFGCNPEGSYANVDCRKYQGQNLSVTNDVIRWTDATNSWALVHPTTGAETTSPCNSQGAFHLATFTEMLKVRDTTTDSTASVVDGFSWFEKFVVGSYPPQRGHLYPDASTARGLPRNAIPRRPEGELHAGPDNLPGSVLPLREVTPVKSPRQELWDRAGRVASGRFPWIPAKFSAAQHFEVRALFERVPFQAPGGHSSDFDSSPAEEHVPT